MVPKEQRDPAKQSVTAKVSPQAVAQSLNASRIAPVVLSQARSAHGRKFRRQHSYGPFIMDFYCPSERLCIELDGPTHDSNDERVHDDMRTEFLNKHLIKVLRFKNEEVYQSVEKVLTKIREVWQH